VNKQPPALFGHTCKGSALTECIIVLILILPIIYATVVLGKLLDLSQTSVQASRYGVWQTTVEDMAKVQAMSKQKVIERFFTNGLLSLSSQSAQASLANSSRHDFLWQNNSAQSIHAPDSAASQLWIDANNITSTYQVAPSITGERGGLSSALADIGKPLASVSGNEWGLSNSGTMQNQLSVPLLPNRWLSGISTHCPGTICVHTRSSIMADGWGASGAEHSRRRVRSLMPASVLEPIGNALAKTGNALILPELKGLQGAFGYVNTSVLPEYARQ